MDHQCYKMAACLSGLRLPQRTTELIKSMNAALPVCRRGPVIAGLADLGVEGVRVLVLVVRVDVGVIVPGAVWPAVPAVHGAVQGVDACVRVLLLRVPLRRAADVQDLGVVPFPGLALPQLPGLGLDPEGGDWKRTC